MTMPTIQQLSDLALTAPTSIQADIKSIGCPQVKCGANCIFWGAFGAAKCMFWNLTKIECDQLACLRHQTFNSLSISHPEYTL